MPIAQEPVVEAVQQNNNGLESRPLNKVNAPQPGRWLSMLATILAESGVGFGVGFTLARNNVAGAIVAIIVLSFVFALEFWMRYGPGTHGAVFFVGLAVLIAAGLIPYLVMSRKQKKGASVYLPTVAASWSGAAILFGLVCAMRSGGKVGKSDAIQGVILSLLYAGVTSAAGYSVGTPGGAKSGNTVFAMMAWGALVMFDLAGLARGP